MVTQYFRLLSIYIMAEALKKNLLLIMVVWPGLGFHTVETHSSFLNTLQSSTRDLKSPQSR